MKKEGSKCLQITNFVWGKGCNVCGGYITSCNDDDAKVFIEWQMCVKTRLFNLLLTI